MIYDFVVIGSGIIGVSVAYNIKLKNPLAKIIILEKEPQSFMHQTSHNSGVIHSGIYYKPNSLKSEFCKIGLKKTYDYCTKYNIKFDKCGKIIAATNKKEQLDLYRLYQNGKESNLPIKLISKNKLRSIEPNLLAVEGIFSPETGIINWKLFANSLLENFLEMGGVISYSYRVNSIDEDDSSVLIIDDKNNKIRSSKVISCGGLQSDRLARLVGIKPNLKIIPFRGDYFKLSKKFNKLFNHLIYPVPDINLPFLGIHFTKTIEEFITIGPNASINF
jgi:L-2-hydroxyglutarate oxidase